MLSDGLAERIIHGDVRAAARLMRDLDDRLPSAAAELAKLFAHTGKAYVIGITGSPGSGKSTLVDALIARYRSRGLKVGVVAVDPTSPFSGGAILGDRIRMQRHATDDGVFIRSLATRGHLGGLSRSTGDVVAVLDAMGFDIVIIETVGVGQDEIDVVGAAETAVVVTIPGLGDDIQAIKAGILEVADVLVVNKADREGADRTVHDLMQMLELRGQGALRSDCSLGSRFPNSGRHVEIVRTIATNGEGVDELVSAVDRHRQDMAAGRGRARTVERHAMQLGELIKEMLWQEATALLDARGGLEAIAGAIADRTRDPYSTASEIITEMLGK